MAWCNDCFFGITFSPRETGGGSNPGGVDCIKFDVNVKQDPEGWGNLITSPSGKHYPVNFLKSKLNALYDSLSVRHVRERLGKHTRTTLKGTPKNIV